MLTVHRKAGSFKGTMAFVITSKGTSDLYIKSVLLPVLFFCGNTPDSAFSQYGHVTSLSCY